MSEFKQGLITGTILAIALLMVIVSLTPSIVKKAHEAINQCELSLPRDQHCKLTAQPMEVER